jgi:hypothetical protein
VSTSVTTRFPPIRVHIDPEMARLIQAFSALQGKTVPETMTDLYLSAIQQDGRIQIPDKFLNAKADLIATKS